MISSKDILKNVKNVDADTILEALGLERRNDGLAAVIPTLGIFGVGILVGAALGLAFAPKAGSDLRTDVTGRFNDLKTRFNSESLDKSAS